MTLNDDRSLWQGSLVAFRNRVAAASPTPGGGAVAAVTATFGAALLRMVGIICLKRTPDAKLEIAIAGVKICEEKLALYADEDVHAFDLYMTARKERTSSVKVQQRLLACAKVPLEAAEQVAKLQCLTTEIAPVSPAFLASDIETARHLLHASLQALLANVATNLSNLEDCEEKRVVQQRFELLRQNANGTSSFGVL